MLSKVARSVPSSAKVCAVRPLYGTTEGGGVIAIGGILFNVDPASQEDRIGKMTPRHQVLIFA